MYKKTFPIDIVSYFFKFLFLLLIGVLTFFFIKETYELCYLLFDKLERNLCIYESILKENNIVSDFLIKHEYQVFGSKAYTFLDGSENILGISIFLRIYEILKYLYYGVIAYLAFLLLKKYSINQIYGTIYGRKTNRLLLYISIMVFIIPFINIFRDLIGCLIINKLPIKESVITLTALKPIYFVIGTLIFGVYYYHSIKINAKDFHNYLYFKKYSSILFITLFGFIFIIDIYNLFTVIKSEKEVLEYYELIKNYDPFIIELVNNFNIFGSDWTYLGLETSLKGPMIIHYSLQTLINLSIIIIFINEFKATKVSTFKIKNDIRNKFYILTIIIITLLINLLINGLVVINYKNNEYFNQNLEYSLMNIEYLYYLFLMSFTIVIAFSLNKYQEV